MKGEGRVKCFAANSNALRRGTLSMVSTGSEQELIHRYLFLIHITEEANDAGGVGPIFVAGVRLFEVSFHVGESLGVTAVFHPHESPVKQRQAVGRVFSQQRIKIGNRFINAP